MAMDDLSDDGVSLPEWQSGSEREPEDDKEIEGNEPDEIPPSDPDSYVGLKEAENNGQWLQCIGKSVEKLPSYDGFLETQLSGMRVPFHVIRSDSTPWDAKQAYSLALLGARMSCDAIDIFRGRQKPAHVERILTEDCMRRLKIAASIIGHCMKEDANLYAKIGLLPINVSAINGWLTSTTKFECAALLNIGETRLRCNTAFRLKGSTWKCVLADFG